MSVAEQEEGLHFLEALFGISPDNGSGQTEYLLLLALLIAMLLLRWRTLWTKHSCSFRKYEDDGAVRIPNSQAENEIETAHATTIHAGSKKVAQQYR